MNTKQGLSVIKNMYLDANDMFDINIKHNTNKEE